MSLARVNGEDVDLVTVCLIEVVVDGTLPPEGWSGEGAKYQDDRLFLEQLG